jgi:asparagine synthase (glutamine-hydrolysing)
MCGICGILRIDPIAPGFDRPLLDRMTDSMAHRGPNDRGVWHDDLIGLGSRRLSVIDLSTAGRMPMTNEDGSVHVVYNGEVYNFRELIERYELTGRHVFRSRTDTEVLVHLYEELGIEMVTQLNGMFGVAIWDCRTRTLYLARDHAGVKPLFYQRDRQFFRFASEIKAILADDRVGRRPSVQALHDFLSFAYVPGSQTAFEDVFEVPPGHWMSVNSMGETNLKRYWEVSLEPDRSLDEQRASRTALELMDAAVARQLVADVPVGVMLSGGLDSSTIVALMSRHTKEPIHTFSVGFDDATFNELPYARMVAERFKTRQHEVVVTADVVRELLPAYLRYIDEPYADGSAIPTYCVCQIAKPEVVVVLSGEGGDEIFAGYDTYAAFRAAERFRRVPAWVSRYLIQPMVNRLPVSDRKLSLEFKLKRFLGGAHLPPEQAHLWWRIVLTEVQKFDLYTPRVLEQMTPAPAERLFIEEFRRSSSGDTLSRLMQMDASIFLPDDLMIKNDRMSMAHSLEARVPMTDTTLVRFMARVPSDLKLKGFRKKHIMRLAMTGLLPDAILNKKKVGLEMPYSRWLKRELKDVVDRHLGRDRIAERGLFRPEAVQSLVDDHHAGRRDNGRALWGLLNYMMWLDLYIP